jgi:hypothetical protein
VFQPVRNLSHSDGQKDCRTCALACQSCQHSKISR